MLIVAAYFATLIRGTMWVRAAIIGLLSLLVFVQRPSLGQAPVKLQFEVATVKPSPKGAPGVPLHPEPGGMRYVGSNGALRIYLAAAYQLKFDQVSGGPGWVDNEPYDLNAKAERPASLEELHVMLQNLLTERFRLQLHHAVKQMPALALTLDKGGPKNLKLRPNANAGDVILDERIEQLVHPKMRAHCASMDLFVFRLEQNFDRPFVNQTGLTGCFDFEFSYTFGPPPPLGEETQIINGVTVDTSGPRIFDALQEQLGLKLEAKQAPVDTLVIDHAERPAGN